MSLTPSTMLSLGTQAPNFSLTDTVSGETISLDSFQSKKALLVVFTSNHCPYAQHIMPGIIEIADHFEEKGLAVVCISSNDVEQYPEDGPKMMQQLAEKEGYPFPYLFDESQEVAQAYTAACTPDLFLFDTQRQLVYRGRFDDSRPDKQTSLTGNDIKSAITSVLADQEVTTSQKPSVGCNIKWKPGNEPDYFA